MELCEPFFVNARNTMGYDIGVNSLKSVRRAAAAAPRRRAFTRTGAQWRRRGGRYAMATRRSDGLRRPPRPHGSPPCPHDRPPCPHHGRRVGNVLAALARTRALAAGRTGAAAAAAGADVAAAVARGVRQGQRHGLGRAQGAHPQGARKVRCNRVGPAW
jgi:hypothetical protein